MAKKTTSKQETAEATQTEKPDVLRLKGLVERVAVRSGARPRDLRPAIEAALAEMQARRITCLFVVTPEGMPAGLIHIHDFLRTGLV